MSDMVEFIRARLDEDERIARAVEDRSDPWHGQWRAEGNQALRTRNGWVLAHNRGEPHVPGLLAHIARHDPARVLAEVDAKRRILDDVVDEASGLDAQVDGEFRVGIRDTKTEPYLGDVLLRLLALPYASHPDYREEWRP